VNTLCTETSGICLHRGGYIQAYGRRVENIYFGYLLWLGNCTLAIKIMLGQVNSMLYASVLNHEITIHPLPFFHMLGYAKPVKADPTSPI